MADPFNSKSGLEGFLNYNSEETDCSIALKALADIKLPDSVEAYWIDASKQNFLRSVRDAVDTFGKITMNSQNQSIPFYHK